MGLFQVIKNYWAAPANLTGIANEVADRCIEAVWLRVQHQVGTLAVAEARGYIRARGLAVVQPQLAAATTQHEVAASLQPQLYSLTVEAVIARVQQRQQSSVELRNVRRAA